MSYRLQVRLAAEADVAEAAEWYDQRQPGLGEKFVREVDQAIARVVENPLAFPVILATFCNYFRQGSILTELDGHDNRSNSQGNIGHP